jgi:diguanylate cyclase (GGDEF)-like protein
MAAVKRYDILDTPADGSFDRVTAMAARRFHVPISIVSIVDSDRIWFKSHHGLDVPEIGREAGLCASAILKDEPHILLDASKDVRSLANPHHAIAVRDLRARKKAEQHIRFLAHHDALTGLPNRSSFAKKLDHEIETALETGKRLAVLCLDIDRFKEVNDLFGHASGDALLQTIASRVTSLLDPNQMFARLGGDEFAIILPGLTDPTVAGRVAENILESLRVEAEQSFQGALISMSIGIAICPNDACDRQTLVSHADTALYRAKLEGRGTYRFFEALMGAQARDRRLLEHDLRQAIARKELSLVYQPQKDIKANEVVGFEALLRWRHATRGDISPSVFIPIAEESGAILAIGEWVLREACREAASWKRPLHVAVNVSAVQLHTANFHRVVHEILIQYGLSPHR